MKIRKVDDENLGKALALLRGAFPGSGYEAKLVERLHEHGRPIYDWVCIHTNKIIAYAAFTTAYQGQVPCGLHLAPLAVKPEFHRQGVGSELLKFCLSQEPIKSHPLFVLGAPAYYQRFGFAPCRMPRCPFAKNNAQFLSIRNETTSQFTVGYEPEFGSGG